MIKYPLKNIVILSLAFITAHSVGDADVFPLCGYGCEQLFQADSCHFNSVLFWWRHSESYVDSIFELAEGLEMKIILGRAQIKGLNNITALSGGQRSVYQAESEAYSHILGEKIYGRDANNDTALVVCSRYPGWIHKNLWAKENYRFHREKMMFYTTFRLKINNNKEIYPVCSLLVRRKEKDSLIVIASRILMSQDFIQIQAYDTFTVPFILEKNQVNNLDYAVWYAGGNDSLFIDEIEVMDATAYRLKAGAFDNDILTTVRYFNKKQSMFRYYLWDEPNIFQFWASGKINSILKYENSKIVGVQAVNHIRLFQTYFDLVNCDELLVDFYPFNGNANYYMRTPKDSGELFQKKLDELCNFLQKTQEIVKLNNREFWYIPQAFGQAITDETYFWNHSWEEQIPYADEGWWREPTPRELSCTVWLALAYGAKGIVYYRYKSRPEKYDLPKYDYRDNHWIVGLVDTTGIIKRPLWYAIQDINLKIENISELLLDLELDASFKSSVLPYNCYIKAIDDPLFQVGLFHKKNKKYFVLVNRHCLPDDIVFLTLQLHNCKKTKIFDYTTNSTIIPCSQENDLYTFKIKFKPGEGKLFRIIN